MKRKGIISIILGVFLFVSGFITVLQAAEIVFIEGKVEVQPAGQEQWNKADLGMQVNIGDSIRTARRSRADIVIDKENKQAIRIEQQTLVVLNSTAAGAINKLDLSHGKIYAKVEKLKEGIGSFVVATPSSIAGVRGSGWSADSNRARDEFSALEHSIFTQAFDAARNLLSETIIEEGLKTIVERFQAAGALTRVSEREIERWNEVRQDLSNRIETGPERKEDKETKEVRGGGETPPTNMEQLNQIEQQAEKTAGETDQAKAEKEEHATEAAIEEQRGGGCH
jgi:hypothetical protein